MAAGALPWWSISLETPWDNAALHSRVSCCGDSTAHDTVGHLIFVNLFSLFIFRLPKLHYITWAMSSSSYYSGWYSSSECVHLIRNQVAVEYNATNWLTQKCTFKYIKTGLESAQNSWGYKTQYFFSGCRCSSIDSMYAQILIGGKGIWCVGVSRFNYSTINCLWRSPAHAKLPLGIMTTATGNWRVIKSSLCGWRLTVSQNPPVSSMSKDRTSGSFFTSRFLNTFSLDVLNPRCVLVSFIFSSCKFSQMYMSYRRLNLESRFASWCL